MILILYQSCPVFIIKDCDDAGVEDVVGEWQQKVERIVQSNDFFSKVGSNVFLCLLLMSHPSRCLKAFLYYHFHILKQEITISYMFVYDYDS